jgi:hypothetical protein
MSIPVNSGDNADSDRSDSEDDTDGQDYRPSAPQKSKPNQESDTEVIEQGPQATPYHCALSYALMRKPLIVSL